jgi:SAM-dependent methyltransferase
MEHEGMVHALMEIRRLLRPDGSLIDIHPVLEAPFVEVHSGDEVSFAEAHPGYEEYDQDLHQAEDALAKIVERGMFALEASREFGCSTYGSSVTELRDFMAKTGAYDTRPVDESVAAREAEMYSRVEEIMKSCGEGAEVAYHERARMSLLTPIR